METKGGVRQELRTDADAYPVVTGKVLVLIDEDPDAGALVLAAALREHGKARIAGTRVRRAKDSIESFVLQRNCPPPVNKCALRRPVGRILPPSGRPLSEAVEVDYPANWKSKGAGKRVVSDWLADGH